MGNIEQAVRWMEQTAKDNSHGYDQIYRWGEKGDYDCSSAVITACQKAGIPVKSNGATYTGNMKPVFLRTGFRDVTNSINLRTGAGLQRGDVLLNTTHHTAMYCGSGQLVQASINEKGTATGGRPGDQTGREFWIRSYYNYPWNCVLRYGGSSSTSTGTGVLRKGSNGKAVQTMQYMLISLGYSCGSAGADGDFGSGTYNALVKFQKDHGLIADGEYGTQSQNALTAAYKAKAGGSKPTVEQAAKDVISGKYGTGATRKQNIERLGLNYSEVQKRVNEILGGQGKNADAVAKEAIAGKWGNGDARTAKLKAAGYDPVAVQKRVNELLRG